MKVGQAKCKACGYVTTTGGILRHGKECPKKLKSKPKTITITSDELEELFDDLVNIDMGGGPTVKITQKALDTFETDSDIIHDFVGWSIKSKANGEHYSDYQIVDYTITFTSPTKIKTIIEAQMSLVNGWIWDEEKYKLKQ